MKKTGIFLAAVLICLSLLPKAVSAKTKYVEFRKVLTQEEAKTDKTKTKYSFVPNRSQKPKEVFVDGDALLTSADIDRIVIIRKEQNIYQGLPIVDMIFTARGADKLSRITSDNIRRELAILVDGELFSTPFIVHPLTHGHYLLTNWKIATNQQAEQFAKDLGFTPAFKTLKKE